MSRFVLFSCLLLAALPLAGCGPAGQSPSVAAKVNGHDISMSAYSTQVKYKRVVSSDTFGIDVCSSKSTAPLCIDLKRSALNGLIEDELVREYATRHRISVSAAEFSARWAAIDQKKFHNQAPVLAAYARRYGLTPAQFKDSIRRDLLRDKVMADVTKTMPTVAPAIEMSRIDVPDIRQVAWVKSQLRSGRSFNAVAAQLNAQSKSLCNQQGGCGEMGWLPTVFVSQSRHAVATAHPGQVLGPYAGQRLFELVKVEARNGAFHMTPAQIYQRRQQLFALWLARQEQGAAIKRYAAT